MSLKDEIISTRAGFQRIFTVIIENFPDFIFFDYLIINFFAGGCCTSKNLISMSTETVRREGGQLGMHRGKVVVVLLVERREWVAQL